MRRLRHLIGASVLAGLGAVPAHAADLAVMVVNPATGERLGPEMSARMDRVERAFRRNGWEVRRIDSAGAPGIVTNLDRLAAELGAADRAAIVAYGALAHTGEDVFVMASGYQDRPVNDLTAAMVGVPLSFMLDLAARSEAPLFLVQGPFRSEAGAGIGRGFAGYEAPAAPLVVGDPDEIIPVLRRFARGEEDRLGALVRGASGESLALIRPAPKAGARAGEDARSAEPSALPRAVPPDTAAPRGTASENPGVARRDGGAGAGSRDGRADGQETVFWLLADRNGEVSAYRDYLERYPEGLYADEARRRIDAADPSAAMTERSLNLDRRARQRLQRQLRLLGHEPGGIDGIFGPETRRAIEGWQRSTGAEATGYLTSEQVLALQNQADAQAATSRASRSEQEQREDARFWRETGSRGGEANLRAYLERYPDGLRSREARRELDRIMEARQLDGASGTEDRGAAANPVEGAMPGAGHPRLKADVGLRRLVERRLSELGYQLEAVDAEFDQSTRRALRRYQRDAASPVTSVADRATMVRLLGVSERG